MPLLCLNRRPCQEILRIFLNSLFFAVIHQELGSLGENIRKYPFFYFLYKKKIALKGNLCYERGMSQTIQDYWAMSPLAAVGLVLLVLCHLGGWKGGWKTAGNVVGWALVIIGIGSFLGSLV